MTFTGSPATLFLNSSLLGVLTECSECSPKFLYLLIGTLWCLSNMQLLESPFSSYLPVSVLCQASQHMVMQPKIQLNKRIHRQTSGAELLLCTATSSSIFSDFNCLLCLNFTLLFLQPVRLMSSVWFPELVLYLKDVRR